MSLHRACCCEPGCNCTGCDFATSYQTACMSWFVNWSYESKFQQPCQGCTEGVEEPVIHDVQVAATYSFRNGPITRFGPGQLGDCCYTRVGVCDVTYSVSILDRGDCCQNSNPCDVTHSYSGTKEISYLLTVTPICVNGNTCAWLHTISVCPIGLGLDEYLFELGPNDCLAGQLDCNNLPLERVGVYLNGGLFQWRTPYQSLNTLNWPSDFTPVALCPSTASGAFCTFSHLAGGNPFSIMFVPDSQYEPQPACPLPVSATTYNFSSTLGTCNGTDNNTANPCAGGYTSDEQCCLKEYVANANPPCYT